MASCGWVLRQIGSPETSERGVFRRHSGTLLAVHAEFTPSRTMRHADDHPDPNARLNLLLSYGGWREHAAVRQLPRLLEPMGIHALQADTGEEAASLIQHQPVHIAVVDLEIPLTRCGSRPVPGGARILQLLRRLDQPPPTIVVRPRQASNRQDVRELMASLRGGAFAVIDRPLQLDTILDTLRRVLRRHYQDAWPPMR